MRPEEPSSFFKFLGGFVAFLSVSMMLTIAVNFYLDAQKKQQAAAAAAALVEKAQ